jgi:hypothetical protein
MVPEAPRNRGSLAGTMQQVRERRLNRQAHGGLEKRIKEFVVGRKGNTATLGY